MNRREIQVGIYVRLSVAQDKKKEDSIEHQILLAREWIEQQRRHGENIREYEVYEDRGITGTTFQRKAFQRMLKDAKEGKIQCIVCKDSSRIGRDYRKTGEYLEKIFPVLRVRVVLLSEGYDSQTEMAGALEYNLRNLVNEWYARDIGRKVLAVKKMQREQGNYLGSRPPYGYQIVKSHGKRRLMEEKTAQKILMKIEDEKNNGKSAAEIRELLWKEGIHPPSVYFQTGRIKGIPCQVKKWDPSVIRRMCGRQKNK